MNVKSQSREPVHLSEISKLPSPANEESKVLSFRQFLALAQERSDRWDELYQSQNNQDNKNIGHYLKLLYCTCLQKIAYMASQVWQDLRQKR